MQQKYLYRDEGGPPEESPQLQAFKLRLASKAKRSSTQVQDPRSQVGQAVFCMFLSVSLLRVLHKARHAYVVMDLDDSDLQVRNSSGDLELLHFEIPSLVRSYHHNVGFQDKSRKQHHVGGRI